MPIDRAVGIDRWITAVAGDQVMQVLLVVVPVAQRNHDVALQALRTHRLGIRQLAFGDTLGPVGEILERQATHLSCSLKDHVLARLSRLNTADPRFFVRLALEVELRNRAG